jgi:lipopolysaccharide heptosyltransferase II
VVNEELAPLVEPTGLVDEIVRFPRRRFRMGDRSSAQGVVSWMRSLRERRFDVTIDLQGLFRSALMCWSSRAPVRIGLASAREGAPFIYTHIVDDRPADRQAVDRYWSVADVLGMGAFPKSFPLNLSSAERQVAQVRLCSLPTPRVAIHPGAKWATKRWPAERFAQAVDAALGQRVGSVVILGGPGEEGLAEIVAHHLRRPFVQLTGQTNLRQLAAILEAVDLLVTNDSGPMHLAAALGTPTVSVFTCTSPTRSGAFGPGHTFVQTNVPCRGSYRKNCSHLSCMKELSADRLVPLLTESLRQAGEGERRQTAA